MSGYVYCACRDCFEIAIGEDGPCGKALCGDCYDAGCEPDNGECEAPGAYGCDDDES